MLSIQPGSDENMSFAHDLTKLNMASYYSRHNRTWDRRIFEKSWAETDNYCLFENDILVGILRCSHDREHFYIRAIQVIPQAQNHGIGAFALLYAESLCKALFFRAIRLHVFEDSPARRLYSRMGFTELVNENDGTLLLEKELA